MDIEILEMVSKALEALTTKDNNTAESILRDIVSVYNERMENEYEVYSDAFQWREKAARKVAISLVSHPEVSLTQQAKGQM